MDDLWTGTAGKTRYLRAAGQNHYRFLFDQEFYLYTNYFVVPLLRTRLNNGQNNYIWLSVLIRYEQIGNPQVTFESFFLLKFFFLIYEPILSTNGPFFPNYYTQIAI